MKRVATAVILIPLVLAAVLLAPADWFLFLLGVVALVAAREFLLLVLQPGETIVFRLVMTVLAVIFCSAILATIFHVTHESFSIVLSILVLIPFILLGIGLGLPDPRRGLESAALSLFAIVYVGIPLFSIWTIRTFFHTSIGSFLVLTLFATVWSGDIAAFYVGRMFGRHKLAPSISPGKTWEGTIASVVLASVVSWIMFRHIAPHYSDFLFAAKIAAPAWLSLGVGALINIAAQFGDLAESMIKRAAGVKDSGTLLPGHGGVLDRIDALLFAAPVAMLLFWFLRSSIVVTETHWVLP